MAPSFDGGDDLLRDSGPFKGFRFFVGLGDEAVDGDLQVDKGIKDATLEATSGELGEVALDGIEPGAGRRGEVEGEARVAVEPGPNLGVLMGGIIVEDGMDRLSGRSKVDGCRSQRSGRARIRRGN